MFVMQVNEAPAAWLTWKYEMSLHDNTVPMESYHNCNGWDPATAGRCVAAAHPAWLPRPKLPCCALPGTSRRWHGGASRPVLLRCVLRPLQQLRELC
jgi:hypothetical protein